jgi:3-deoxy-manno-octulosonate cytidylyltransferase (CMP-KDO synthetase)
MKYLAVIPVRLKSNRFPNKILKPLMGKPILSWVIEYAQKVFFFNDIIVATEDKEIASFVMDNHRGISVFMNQRPVNCGTERLLEVSKAISNYNMYVSLPADEPLIDYKEINKLQEYIDHGFSDDVLTLYSKFYCKEDLESSLSCKIVTTYTDHLLYSSRAVIPTTKDGRELDLLSYKKHVGVTFFPEYFLFKHGEALWGKWESPLAKAESLEQNRFLDYGAKVKMLEIKHDYFGVDQEWQLKILEDRFRALNS